ncbi:type II secretion system F family protein (plasmid) [Kozakia baliensis]|uniref:type II secretion system F family protein n=1 Tax=Kozakia baliensis TaxID=153496 RepID=UPI00345BCC96
MTQFFFLAVDGSGATVKGHLEAESEAAVLAQLRQDGRIPMRVDIARIQSTRGSLANFDLFRRHDLRRSELAGVTRELAIMLDAGQDIDRALRFLIQTTPTARVQSVLEAIRSEVRDGKALHKTMEVRPRSFPRLYVGMVRAAEASGDLAPTMARLALLMDRERALSTTIGSALIYPAMLILAASGSIYFLLTDVLPQFVPLFEQNGAALPLSTQFMIWLGERLRKDFLTGLGIGLAGILLGVQLARRPKVRYSFDAFILRLPLVGSLIREIIAARFTRIFGTMLENGVPLLNALTITQDAIGNRAARNAIEAALQGVKAGRGLSGTLSATRIFPTRTTQLLLLGEETARLGSMAVKAAEIHEEQVRIVIQRLLAFLVPTITIVMGLIVAGIVSSLLLAMLGLNDLAK